MLRVCVFDLNGTLLDLSALDPLFRAVFADPQAGRLWFDQLLELALVSNHLNDYRDFGTLAGAALEMLATRHQADLTPEAKQEILQALRRLPAYPDVRPGLERLRASGMPLAALTNSASDAAHAQVQQAGLADLFEQVLSVDAVQRFKPAPEVYRMAADRLGASPGETCLIAAHSWDLAGAHAAGWRTAFLARPDEALDPLRPPPTYHGTTLTEIAEAIVHDQG